MTYFSGLYPLKALRLSFTPITTEINNKCILLKAKNKAINLKVYMENLIIKMGSSLLANTIYIRTAGLSKLDINKLVNQLRNRN